jgi:2'-5' RNA ligase
MNSRSERPRQDTATGRAGQARQVVPAAGAARDEGRPQSRRLFVALRVPPQVQRHLAAARDELGDAARAFRWVRPEAMHLTLVFLGATPEPLIPGIETVLADAAAASQPLRLAAEGVGCFPNARRPRVLWAGVVGDVDALRSLQHAVDAGLRGLGITLEDRPFRAHLTLARAAANGLPPSVADLAERVDTWTSPAPAKQFGQWRTGEVELIHSRLTPSGSIYTTLFTAPLGGTPPGGGAGRDTAAGEQAR